MRPIERKIFNKITDKGITDDGILEILDGTGKTEMKKSFQDDCLFQSDKYFAKVIIKTLISRKLIFKEGNKYFKQDKKKKSD